MAINPSLALQVKPLDIADPIEQFTKVAQARNLIGQGALRQQQMEHTALAIDQQRAANAEQQRGLAEAETQRQVIQAAGGDLKKAREILGTTPGVSRDTLTKFDDEIDKHATAIAKQDEQKFTKFTNHLAAASEGLMAVDALGPDPAAQKPVYDARQQGMIDAGLLDPKEARPYAGPDQIKQDLAKVVSLKQVNDLAAAKREQLKGEHDQKMFPLQEKKEQADAGTAVAKEGQTKLQNAVARLSQAANQEEYTAALGTLDAQTAAQLPQQFDKKKLLALGQTPNEQVTAEAMDARNKRMSQHESVLEGQGKQRLAYEGARVAREQKQFDATYGALLDADGKPMAPEAAKAVAMQDPIAVAVANYQTAPPPVGRAGPGAGILRKALAINPDYDAKNWQNQGKVLNDFSTGKSAQELGAASVALGHLGVMKEAVAALNNGDIRILNAIGNRLGLETGSSPSTVFRTIVHRVGPELSKAYIASGGGVHERGAAEADFDPSLGPKILSDNIAISGKLLDGKIEQKKQQWKNVMGTRPFPGLTEQAEAARAAIGGKKAGPAVGTVKDGYRFKGGDPGLESSWERQ